MCVLIICKKEEDSIKNEGARVASIKRCILHRPVIEMHSIIVYMVDSTLIPIFTLICSIV